MYEIPIKSIQMKKFLFAPLLLLGIVFIPMQMSDAHPGNTASDGCHYCRTNCASWGEVYGARHCHGGYSSYSYTPVYESKEVKDIKCNQKYPGTEYSYFGDKCICPSGKPFNENYWKCPELIPQTQNQSTRTTNATTSSDNSGKDRTCSQKYPGTIYQASGDKCICPSGKPFNASENMCPEIKQSYNNRQLTEKDKSCNAKYAGTIYQANGDKCVCPNGKPFNENTWQCSG